MTEPVRSRRGVYYDLTKSPFEFTNSFGDLFKFSSQKKLDMYTRDIEKELERLEKCITRNEMQTFVPEEIKQLLRRAVHKALYKKIEG